MAATVRLARFGGKGQPHYRIVVAHRRNARDSRFIEVLGSYDPHKGIKDAKVNKERMSYWRQQGATFSSAVEPIYKSLTTS